MTDLSQLVGQAVDSDAVLKPPAEAARAAAIPPARALLVKSLASGKAFSIPVDSKQAGRKLRSLFREAGKTGDPAIRVLVQEDVSKITFQGVKGRTVKVAV